MYFSVKERTLKKLGAVLALSGAAFGTTQIPLPEPRPMPSRQAWTEADRLRAAADYEREQAEQRASRSEDRSAVKPAEPLAPVEPAKPKAATKKVSVSDPTLAAAIERAGYARAAGFRGSRLVTAVAISLAEQRPGNPDMIGDERLADAVYGPSYHWWQIRSVNAEKGTGKSRDANRLMEPAFNAASAFEIAGTKKGFGHWTMYKNGEYRQFVDTARQAVYSLDASLGL